MLYYSFCNISDFTDDDTDFMREAIKEHFADKTNIKRRESVAAKALLCLLLKKIYGISNYTVDCDKNEKPYIVDSNISFNISHSGDYILCAVGDEKTGCDIQQVKPYNEKVAKRFFTTHEFAKLEKSNNQPLDFTRLWTLKESALKFSGTGISGGLDLHDFSEYYKKESFSHEGLMYNIFEIPGYVISICSESGKLFLSDVSINDIKNFGI